MRHQNSRKTLNPTFEEAGIGMAIVGIDGRVLNANAALQEMLGYDWDDLATMTLAEITHPEDYPENGLLARELVSFKREAYRLEKRLIRKDGQIVWGRISASLVRDTNGQPSYLIGLVEDITGYKRAVMELSESESRYRLVSENTLDIIWTMNMDLVFTYVNSAIYKIAGYRPEEWIGTHLSDHCDEENFAYMAQLVAEELAKGPENSDIIFEAVMFKKHRIATPVEIHCKVIYDETGQPTGLHGTTRDISERIEREAVNKQLQQKLIQAQKMEAVGRLAGGMANDFNNMLSIIMGYAEIALAKVSPDDSLYSDLNEILYVTQRSTEITRQLLAFARRQNIAPKVIDINEAVGEMLNILKRLMGENIKLTWDPEPGIWPVKMDPIQLDQILTNLCVNSRDAMGDAGNIIIEVKNTRLDPADCIHPGGFVPGEYVRVSVSDTGVGMDSETLNKVFEPFFSTKDLGKGTGLGLATVYGIVKQNNGFIHVHSEPGRGTTVQILLPRQPEPKMKNDFHHLPSGHGELILLVDADAAILDITRDLLETLGYSVLPATRSDEALALAHAHGPDIDLLITRVMTPEMNGRELAGKIKHACPNLKVLFMLGYSADDMSHREILEEGLCFLQKPFSKEHLAEKVREAMEAWAEKR